MSINYKNVVCYFWRVWGGNSFKGFIVGVGNCCIWEVKVEKFCIRKLVRIIIRKIVIVKCIYCSYCYFCCIFFNFCLRVLVFLLVWIILWMVKFICFIYWLNCSWKFFCFVGELYNKGLRRFLSFWGFFNCFFFVFKVSINFWVVIYWDILILYLYFLWSWLMNFINCFGFSYFGFNFGDFLFIVLLFF